VGIHAEWLWQEYLIQGELDEFLAALAERDIGMRYLFAPSWWSYGQWLDDIRALGIEVLEAPPRECTRDILDLIWTLYWLRPLALAGVGYTFRAVHDGIGSLCEKSASRNLRAKTAFGDMLHDDFEGLDRAHLLDDDWPAAVALTCERIEHLWDELLRRQARQPVHVPVYSHQYAYISVQRTFTKPSKCN